MRFVFEKYWQVLVVMYLKSAMSVNSRDGRNLIWKEQILKIILKKWETTLIHFTT